MARAQIDMEGNASQTGFEPVPAGFYPVQVSETDVKTSQAGNKYIEVVFEIQGDSYAGRLLWSRFVIGNEIAQNMLKGLLEALGHPNPNYLEDTEEMHGLQCLAKVKIKQEDGYEPKNEIAYYKPVSNQTSRTKPATPKPATAAPAKSDTPTKAKTPWG